MLVGSIRRCPLCKKESYIRLGIDQCPICQHKYDVWIPNKAPAGWLKQEPYEISRRTVEGMVRDGMLSKKDLDEMP